MLSAINTTSRKQQLIYAFEKQTIILLACTDFFVVVAVLVALRVALLVSQRGTPQQIYQAPTRKYLRRGRGCS